MSLISCIDKPTMAENLFGKSPDPNCTGDCKLVERYLSIFPLRNENIDDKTKLTEMTYKTIMFTTDNLIIFDSDVQKEGCEWKDGKTEIFKEKFLNLIPMQNF